MNLLAAPKMKIYLMSTIEAFMQADIVIVNFKKVHFIVSFQSNYELETII